MDRSAEIPSISLAAVVRLVVAPELDESVDHTAWADARSGESFDRRSACHERTRELVLAELDAADPDEHERVVRRQLRARSRGPRPRPGRRATGSAVSRIRWSSASPRSRCAAASFGSAVTTVCSRAISRTVGGCPAEPLSGGADRCGPGRARRTAIGSASGRCRRGPRRRWRRRSPAAERRNRRRPLRARGAERRVRVQVMTWHTGVAGARMSAERPATLDDATRVQDAERVERGLDRAHDADRVGAALDLEPVAPRRRRCRARR